jgi:HSP20 family molecular chaperone IbpA
MSRRRDIDRLIELEELFADLWQVPRFAAGTRWAHRPQLDVFRTDDPPELPIVVELPGADPNRIRIEVDGPRLVIAGERPRPRGAGRVWYRSEIEYGPFERELSLAVEVDVNEATATYERGLLRIVRPLSQQRTATARVPIEVRRSG